MSTATINEPARPLSLSAVIDGIHEQTESERRDAQQERQRLLDEYHAILRRRATPEPTDEQDLVNVCVDLNFDEQTVQADMQALDQADKLAAMFAKSSQAKVTFKVAKAEWDGMKKRHEEEEEKAHKAWRNLHRDSSTAAAAREELVKLHGRFPELFADQSLPDAPPALPDPADAILEYLVSLGDAGASVGDVSSSLEISLNAARGLLDSLRNSIPPRICLTDGRYFRRPARPEPPELAAASQEAGYDPDDDLDQRSPPGSPGSGPADDDTPPVPHPAAPRTKKH